MVSTTVNAASFSTSITKTKIEKGATTTLTIKANNAAGMYKVSISDTSILSISSGSASEFIENGSAKIVLKAKKAGTVKVTATALDMTNSDNSSEKVKGSDVYTINVTDSSSSKNNTTDSNKTNETKKSSNANLSTLGITPKKYDFSGFTANKTSYSVTIPNDIDSLNVAYKTADSKASVKITGNKNLEVGTNNIKVVVTAEDGKTTKTYTIKVTKLATEEEKPGNLLDEDTSDLYLKSLSINDLKLSPDFSSNVYLYETTIDMDKKDMSEVKVNAVANSDKATIEITGNDNLVEGENLINIIVKSENSSEQTVYQITVNKVSQASEIVSTENATNSNAQLLNKKYIILGIIIILVIIIVIVILIRNRRDRYYYEEDDDEYYDDENELKTDNAIEENDNIVEKLFNDNKTDITDTSLENNETEQEIKEENDRIFNKNTELLEEEQESSDENYIEKRNHKKNKGKHF